MNIVIPNIIVYHYYKNKTIFTGYLLYLVQHAKYTVHMCVLLFFEIYYKLKSDHCSQLVLIIKYYRLRVMIAKLSFFKLTVGGGGVN